MVSHPWARLRNLLAAPVDGTSLAVFRMAFGLVMAYHALYSLWPRYGTTLLARTFLDVGWHFTYPGFAWVQPLPQPFLSLVFVVMALAGLGVALGFFHRTSAVVLFFTYTYTFLLEEARYNNHYYLMSMLAFLLIGMPAQARWSIHSWLRGRRSRLGDHAGEAPTPASIPFWPVFLLRAQLFVVYFFGGVAKINADWLTGMPLLPQATTVYTFLNGFAELPGFVSVRTICLFLVWGGLVFDLAIGFLLLWRRTRILALLLILCFHGTNHFLFTIGVFPILAIAATLLFLEPDWPVRVWGWLKRPRLARPDWRWLLGGAVAVPGVGAVLGWRLPPSGKVLPACKVRWPGLMTACVVGWVVTQALLPLRHYGIAGDANWTEEGHKFSWRMMLRHKTAANLFFEISDPGLHIAVAGGIPQIDWTQWPADEPHVVYAAADATKMNWSQLPEVLVIHEDFIGGRVVYNPLAGTAGKAKSLDAARQRIDRLWQRHYGRAAKTEPTVSPPAALRRLRRSVAQAAKDDPGARKSLGKLANDIDQALVLIALLREKAGKDVGLANQLDALLQKMTDSDHGSLVRAQLSLVHPFALEGGAFPGTPFLVIEDAELTAATGGRELRRLSGGKDFPVFVDLGRLRFAGWQSLPRTLFCCLEGKPRVLWNFYRELNRFQIEKLAVHPHMLHQYAGHIAEAWEAGTGRRPAVHVRAPVMLNFRAPQWLVDPRVDLAGVPYLVWRHNPWITAVRGAAPVDLFGRIAPPPEDDL